MNSQQVKTKRQVHMYLAGHEIRLEKLAHMLLSNSGTDVVSPHDAAKVLRRRSQHAVSLNPNELQREVNKLVAEIISSEPRKFIHVEGADCPPQQRSGRLSWQIADDLIELEAMHRWLQKERTNLLEI